MAARDRGICAWPGLIGATVLERPFMIKERIETLMDEAGHLAGAPELIIEVLSKSQQDKDRDRKFKLKLYSVEGVQEYWIFDREQTTVEIFRRDNGVLTKAATLYAQDSLTSPLLPEFGCAIASLFT